MSARRKGIVGEELPAALFAVILLFVFILFVMHSYNDFFARTAFIEQERAASILASKVAYSHGCIVTDPAAASMNLTGLKDVKVVITNTQTGQSWSHGAAGGTRVGVGSLALLIHNATEGMYYPGRVDVHVGA